MSGGGDSTAYFEANKAKRRWQGHNAVNQRRGETRVAYGREGYRVLAHQSMEQIMVNILNMVTMNRSI
jgi:hypothetical protein